MIFFLFFKVKTDESIHAEDISDISEVIRKSAEEKIPRSNFRNRNDEVPAAADIPENRTLQTVIRGLRGITNKRASSFKLQPLVPLLPFPFTPQQMNRLSLRQKTGASLLTVKLQTRRKPRWETAPAVRKSEADAMALQPSGKVLQSEGQLCPSPKRRRAMLRGFRRRRQWLNRPSHKHAFQSQRRNQRCPELPAF